MSREQLTAEHRWRSYTENQRDMAPAYCPGCGNALHGPSGALVLLDGDEGPVWDAYCAVCDWSGEISPDLSLGTAEAPGRSESS